MARAKPVPKGIKAYFPPDGANHIPLEINCADKLEEAVTNGTITTDIGAAFKYVGELPAILPIGQQASQRAPQEVKKLAAEKAGVGSVIFPER